MAPKTDARQRMINVALDLFHRQGVNATSVDQILAKSDTGKSQFSHYFKNKEGLIHAVLVFLHEVIQSGQAETGYDIDSWIDFENWFQTYINFQKSVKFEYSCPIGTIGTDVTNDQDLLRQDVRLFLQWCHGQMARFFAKKKAAGELVASADPDGLADLCISVMQGGMLLTKIKRDPSMFENAAEQALAYVKSLRKKRRA